VRAGDAVVAVAGALVLPPLGHVLVVAAADPAAWHHALHAIRTALLDNGCTTVEATAAADAVAPWHTNDFADLQELLCLAGGVAKAAQSDAVLPLEPRHHFGLLHLDRQVNAPGRLPLLLEHDYLAQVLERAGAVRGVLFPLLGEGLIMAADASAGLELQRWLLPVASAPGAASRQHRGRGASTGTGLPRAQSRATPGVGPATDPKAGTGFCLAVVLSAPTTRYANSK
jgi:hypothetical protein